MKANKLQEMEDSIRNASPLDLVVKLQEAELYDQKETRTIVDEVYEEFNSKGNLVDEVVVPVFLSIADGFLECTAATRKLRKKGLTATKIVTECKNFSYEKFENDAITPDGYVEWKNISEQTESDFKDYAENVRKSYTRKVYEDKQRLNEYKEKIFANNGGRINAVDEYTGQRNVYKEKANPDARRSIQKYKHDHLAEVDHIVPLKQIHEHLKGNYALTDEDIKNISNQDSNFALTSARINRDEGASGKGGKFEKTNTEFVKEQRERKRQGNPNLDLSEEAMRNMLQMEKDAQNAINHNANKAIGNTLFGKGTGNTGEVWGKTAENAASQSKDYVVGNVILFMIKPLYYEISDIFKNGLKEGIGADTIFQAFKLRFNRVKDYVMANALSFIGNNIWEFLKGFISSLIEGIISLFVGIFKQILKLVKEGIKVFAQSAKILFGKESKNLSTAEKGDAIVKILGGSVLSICGIGIEALLNRIGITEPWSVVLSTMLAGIASTMFMLVLDKIDLFSVKDEKRRKRIEEIFAERIKDIKQAQDTLNTSAIETMRRQRLQFNKIRENIWEGINCNNIDSINDALFDLASFMGIRVNYQTTEEFAEEFDSMCKLSL